MPTTFVQTVRPIAPDVDEAVDVQPSGATTTYATTNAHTAATAGHRTRGWLRHGDTTASTTPSRSSGAPMLKMPSTPAMHSKITNTQ